MSGKQSRPAMSVLQASFTPYKILFLPIKGETSEWRIFVISSLFLGSVFTSDRG